MEHTASNHHMTNNCDDESIYDYHADYDIQVDTLQHKPQILKKMQILKKHAKYKIMMQKNMPLLDCELFAMICWTDYSSYCRKMKASHRVLINDGPWKELYFHATNAIVKMHRVFHYENKNETLPSRLHHGSEIVSLDPLSQEQLFLPTLWSFTTEFLIAKAFSTGSIWIMDNVDKALRSGIVTGADI
eukprot:436629_1